MRFGELEVVCRSVCHPVTFPIIFRRNKDVDDVGVDFEYYLSQQILPPIERLCEPIEGTDRARLADWVSLLRNMQCNLKLMTWTL